MSLFICYNNIGDNMAKKVKKTNALRLLDQKKLEYTTYEYEVPENHIDGSEVADMIGKPIDQVYKTLVCVSGKENFVFVVPVFAKLSLKKAAKAAQVKKMEMIPMKELLPLTGYIHGGCSPIGMKKQFKTFIHEDIKYSNIVFSAGKRGLQVEVPVEVLEILNITKADILE